MGAWKSLRSLLRRIRHEGIGCVPGAVYTRGMTLIHRGELRREQALRAADEAAYQAFIARHTRPDPTPFATNLTLSFLIPVYNTEPGLLRQLADSLLAQSCPRWEACLFDGASTRQDTRTLLAHLAQEDCRFRVHRGEENLGISGNTNAAYAMARGDVMALCDHDDLLAPDAVRCLLQAAQDGAEMIYTDEDKVTKDGKWHFDPHLKPDFAPDSLRAGNYICHLTALTRGLAERIAGRDGQLLRSVCDGSQDHDLALRASEMAARIAHIPRILYHWRMLDTSFSHQRAEKCALAACRATADQLARLGLPGKVQMEQLRVRILPESPLPPITAIVVGAGRIPRMDAQVIRVDHIRDVNDAARAAAGEYLLLLHAGMRPLDKDWLREMCLYAGRKDVGCVGSAILDGQRFYRHAGYAVDVPCGAASHHAGQFLYGHPYMITDRLVRNVTGVSTGLMMIRRETFLGLSGLADYDSDLAGADLGLRCLEAGLVNVYTPHARMVCRGRLPCLTETPLSADLARFDRRWYPRGDERHERYYSPLFARDGSMRVDMKQEAAP